MARRAARALLVAAALLEGSAAARAKESPPAKGLAAELDPKFRQALSAFAPAPAEALPAFARSLRVRTAHLDLSTTHQKEDLDGLARVAEKTRVALGHVLGVPEDAPLVVRTPLVFVWRREYDGWVSTLEMPEDERTFALGLAAYARGGLNLVTYEPYASVGQPDKAKGRTRLVATHDLASHVVAAHLVRRWKMPALLAEGLKHLASQLVVGTTMTHTAVWKSYETGLRDHQPLEEAWEEVGGGRRFNPRYLTEQMKHRRDEDLRLLMGRKLDSLKADDDVKGYFFVRWLVEDRDPGHTRMRAWLDAMAAGDEPESALRVAFGLAEEPRVYESVDAAFRAAHGARYPVRVPDRARMRALAGVWDSPLSEAAKNRGAKIPPYRLELKSDGTYVERRDGVPEDLTGTWYVFGVSIEFHAKVEPGSTAEKRWKAEIRKDGVIRARGFDLRRKR